MSEGKFIVVEGIEGSGKTTICKKIIKKILYQHNITNTIYVREPGSTPLSEKIRHLLKFENNINEKISNETELLLFYAARMQLINNIVKPKLKKGIWVIGDRHILSSFAYQSVKKNTNINVISSLNSLFLKNFYPNITFYLDVIPEIGLNRIKNRINIDRIEKKNIKFFHNVRNNYLKLIKTYPKIIKINANYDKKTVHTSFKSKFHSWLNQINEFIPLVKK